MMRPPPFSSLFPYTTLFRSRVPDRRGKGLQALGHRQSAPSPQPEPLGDFGEGADCRRSEEHMSELQSQSNLVCRLLLAKKKNKDEVKLESQRQGVEDSGVAL